MYLLQNLTAKIESYDSTWRKIQEMEKESRENTKNLHEHM